MDRIKQIREYAYGLLALAEQYEAEDKAKFDAAQLALPIGDEGWIEWKGGECPVLITSLVKIRYRGRAAPSRGVVAGKLCWKHCGAHRDIIAYRIAGERT